MALTEAQIRSTFEILHVPYSTSYNTLSEMGTLTALTDFSGSSQAAAKTSILAAIAALTTDDQVKVTALVTEWDAIGNSIVSIDGAMGEISGVKYDPEKHRDKITDRMQHYLPYFKYHQVIEKRQGTTNGINIGVIR